MTGIYGWLAGKAWWLVIVAALCVVILGQRAQVSNAKAATARVQADFADWKATAAENRTLADRAQRTEEQRREDSTRKVIDEARTETLAAQADAVRAASAAGRLSGQLAAYVARARAAGANPAPAAGSPSQLGADPLDLLAQLYGGSDRASGEIGRFADALRIAGFACERAHDGLQPAGPAADPEEVKP